MTDMLLNWIHAALAIYIGLRVVPEVRDPVTGLHHAIMHIT